MIAKLLTEHHLEILSFYTCQNATLLEISCTGSFSNNVGMIDGKPMPS